MNTCERLIHLVRNPLTHLLVLTTIIFSFLYLDRPLAEYLTSLHLKTNFVLLKTITHLGIGGIYFVSYTLLALLFRYIVNNRIWEEKAWFLLISVLIPCIICGVLKIFFGRARPNLWFNEHLFGFYWFKLHVPYWSFPSGHTTTIISVVLGLSILFPRFCIPLLTAGFCVALSRILLTQHYLSDVLFATYLVFIEMSIILMICKHFGWFKSVWQARSDVQNKILPKPFPY